MLPKFSVGSAARFTAAGVFSVAWGCSEPISTGASAAGTENAETAGASTSGGSSNSNGTAGGASASAGPPSSGGAGAGGKVGSSGGLDPRGTGGVSGALVGGGAGGRASVGGGESKGGAGLVGHAGGSSGAVSGNTPVFVALGHVGRTLVSCDAGQSWSLDRDEDLTDQISCVSIDCDHHLYSAKDFTYDAGWFISTLGWGHPSTVRRSRDGFHWETVSASLPNYDFDNVIGDGSGRFILLDRYDARVSSDHGATWTKLGEIPLGTDIYNIRVAGLGGNKLIAFADQRTIHWSSDWGATWRRPSTVDSDCNFDFYNSGLASGMGRTVTVGTGGKGCYTADDAETFHGLDTTLSESVGQVIWSGSEFMIWGVNRVARSRDGAAWTSTATTLAPPGTFRPDAVAKAADGTYVAAMGQYATQSFFRSTDGVAWQRLASAPQGHPIRKIVAGYAPADGACKP